MKNREKILRIIEKIKIIVLTLAGIIATGYNLKASTSLQVQAKSIETGLSWIKDLTDGTALLNSFVALLTGVFTIIFLYHQIKDLKAKAKERKAKKQNG